MKTPRIFILIGACAFLFCFAAASMDPLLSPATAGELPIMRVDPRGGDPDEPDPSYAMPFDDWEYSVGTEPALGTSLVYEAQAGFTRLWTWLTSRTLFRVQPRGR